MLINLDYLQFNAINHSYPVVIQIQNDNVLLYIIKQSIPMLSFAHTEINSFQHAEKNLNLNPD